MGCNPNVDIPKGGIGSDWEFLKNSKEFRYGNGDKDSDKCDIGSYIYNEDGSYKETRYYKDYTGNYKSEWYYEMTGFVYVENKIMTRTITNIYLKDIRYYNELNWKGVKQFKNGIHIVKHSDGYAQLYTLDFREGEGTGFNGNWVSQSLYFEWNNYKNTINPYVETNSVSLVDNGSGSGTYTWKFYYDSKDKEYLNKTGNGIWKKMDEEELYKFYKGEDIIIDDKVLYRPGLVFDYN